MPDNDDVRRSISATVDEMVAGYQRLGLPMDEDDFEAWVILDRIEKRLRRRMGKEAA